MENPVDDAEISDYELKQHFVAVVRKIVEDLEHETQISNQANEQDVITETELEIFTSLSCSRWNIIWQYENDNIIFSDRLSLFQLNYHTFVNSMTKIIIEISRIILINEI